MREQKGAYDLHLVPFSEQPLEKRAEVNPIGMPRKELLAMERDRLPLGDILDREADKSLLTDPRWIFAGIATGLLLCVVAALVQSWNLLYLGFFIASALAGYYWILAFWVLPYRALRLLRDGAEESSTNGVACPRCGRFTEDGNYCRHCGSRF